VINHQDGAVLGEAPIRAFGGAAMSSAPIPRMGCRVRALRIESECGGDLERALAAPYVARPPARSALGLQAHRSQQLVRRVRSAPRGALRAQNGTTFQGLAAVRHGRFEHAQGREHG